MSHTALITSYNEEKRNNLAYERVYSQYGLDEETQEELRRMFNTNTSGNLSISPQLDEEMEEKPQPSLIRARLFSSSQQLQHSSADVAANLQLKLRSTYSP